MLLSYGFDNELKERELKLCFMNATWLRSLTQTQTDFSETGIKTSLLFLNSYFFIATLLQNV